MRDPCPSIVPLKGHPLPLGDNRTNLPVFSSGAYFLYFISALFHQVSEGKEKTNAKEEPGNGLKEQDPKETEGPGWSGDKWSEDVATVEQSLVEEQAAAVAEGAGRAERFFVAWKDWATEREESKSELMKTASEKLEGIAKGMEELSGSCEVAGEVWTKKALFILGLLTDPVAQLHHMEIEMAESTEKLKGLIFSWDQESISQHVKPFIEIVMALHSYIICIVDLLFKGFAYLVLGWEKAEEKAEAEEAAKTSAGATKEAGAEEAEARVPLSEELHLAPLELAAAEEKTLVLSGHGGEENEKPLCKRNSWHIVIDKICIKRCYIHRGKDEDVCCCNPHMPAEKQTTCGSYRGTPGGECGAPVFAAQVVDTLHGVGDWFWKNGASAKAMADWITANIGCGSNGWEGVLGPDGKTVAYRRCKTWAGFLTNTAALLIFKIVLFVVLVVAYIVRAVLFVLTTVATKMKQRWKKSKWWIEAGSLSDTGAYFLLGMAIVAICVDVVACVHGHAHACHLLAANVQLDMAHGFLAGSTKIFGHGVVGKIGEAAHHALKDVAEGLHQLNEKIEHAAPKGLKLSEGSTVGQYFKDFGIPDNVIGVLWDKASEEAFHGGGEIGRAL